MSDDPSKRGLNPHATVFVPNVNARPFVPGQAVHVAVPPDVAVARATHEPDGDSNKHCDTNPTAPPPQLAAASSEAWDSNDEPTSEPVSGSSSTKGGDHESEPTPTAIREPSALSQQHHAVIAPPPDALPKPPKKKIPAASDEKRKEHVNMVFIGHVDAGKSTIGGHLMYLTGMVDKRTLEKYEKEAKDKGRESWYAQFFVDRMISAWQFRKYLSWALDTNEEEREKGKTVECGRAYFETENRHFTILDAPGHKSFVPNMISGATQADLAVLVISARRGEFETGFDRGGQTREHAVLVKTTGVKHMVILVNKMDDPTVAWDEARYIEIQNKLTPFLRNKCGFNPKTDIIYIPCSGLTGAFLKERPEAQFASWYTGPCFIEYIDTLLPNIARDLDGPVRLVVADKYNDMGTVVIGKIESGQVTRGQNLLLMPNRTTVQVIQLWSDENETDRAVSGENVKIKLKGVEDADILSGFVLCSSDAPCRVGRIFDAEVVILEHKSIICSGYSCVLHIHAGIEEVVVKALICTIDKKTGAKVMKRFVRQDEKCIMRLESAEAFCLEPFKEFPQMGRFTLRDEGKTIAIGKVLKVIE